MTISVLNRLVATSDHVVRNWKSILLGTITLTIILWSAVKVPGLSLGAKFTPANPRLGETLVININTTPSKAGAPIVPPTVKVSNKTYPVFGLSGDRFRVMIPTTPLEKPGLREVIISENHDPKSTTTLQIAVADRKFPTQRINFTPGKAGLEATEMELRQVAAFKATVSPVKLWTGKFSAPSPARTSSPYGVRRYYNGEFATDYYHRGLDYAGAYGSPVVAPAAGKVVLVGYEKKGFLIHGNVVGVDHGQGVVSIFMHLSKINVEAGQMLVEGDSIGAIGNTGSSAGAHLHWGLYVNAVSVDPVQWRSTAIE